MILSNLDFNVVIACLRYVAMEKEKLSANMLKAGNKIGARAQFEFAQHAARLADDFEKTNPKAAWRAKRAILPPSFKH